MAKEGKAPVCPGKWGPERKKYEKVRLMGSMSEEGVAE